jgi:hypothetical protein
MKVIWSLLLLAIPAAAAEIRVCFVDDVGILPSVQSIARVQGVWMLAQTGVSVRWEEGECRAGEITIQVRIAAQTSATVHPGALAYAEPFADRMNRITVLYDRVRFVSERRLGFEGRLLAHVLVHEIGHVLMRTDAHSDTGVMKARWTAEDFDRMARIPLRFTAMERELLSIGNVTRAGGRPSDAPGRLAVAAQ